MHIRILALNLRARSFRATTSPSIQLRAAVDERTETGIGGIHTLDTVYGAEIVPEAVTRWLQVVLYLPDAGWGDAVVGEIT